MRHVPVVSMLYMGYGYDPEGHSLEVVHRNGDVHRYHGVSVKVYERLLSAPEMPAFVTTVLDQDGFSKTVHPLRN